MTSTLATRYACRHNISVLCDKGEGVTSRKRCKYCGDELVAERGMYGVFLWNGRNVYPRHGAVSLHRSPTVAARKADALLGHVVRWVSTDV